jgi:hypothetical protein
VRARAVAGAIAALVLAGAAASVVAASGCPARDLVVEITSEGAETLVVACESSRSACEPATSCHRNHLLCNQETCELRGKCQVNDGDLEWTPAQPMGMRLLLLQFNGTAVSISSASACVPINLRPCILDTDGGVGCPCIQGPLGPQICSDPRGTATPSCLRDTVAQAVQAAIGSGISGFTDLSNVALVAAFFTKGGAPAPCDAGVLVNPSDCAPGNLIAVAGLAAPAGSTTYDITCASCQGGTHGSYGPDNAPCPATTDACFLQRVDAALVASGM